MYINDSYKSSVDSLPHQIGDLTELTELTINDFRIKHLPPEIGNLKKLKKCQISQSCEMDTLFPNIGYLTELTELTLDENEFTYLPPEIGNLTKLTQLTLNENRIKYLPPEIGNLTKLHTLVICENRIQTLPSTIGNLNELRYLNIDDEDDLLSLPTEIKHLTKLEYLNIPDIRRLKSLPKEIGSLINLKTLRIEADSITDLSFGIDKLLKLEELFIVCPLLKNDSLLDAVYSVVKLNSLQLNISDITRIQEGIKNLNGLHSLRLDENNISYLTPEIGTLSKLTILKMECNKLKNLPNEIKNLKPDSLCDFGYNYLKEKELSDEVVRWLDTYDPDWRSTQKITAIEYSTMNNAASWTLAYNIRTKVVTFTLNQPGKVNLKLFDVSGKCKRILVDKIIGSGIKKYDLNNDNSSLCNGTYFLRLQVYNGSTYTSQTNKIVYL